PKPPSDPASPAAIWRKLQAINPDIGPHRKVVILNPNASQRFPMRRLPIDAFADLARRLLEDSELFIVITGVQSEKPDAEYISSRVRSPRILDLTGGTTMEELLHLFDLPPGMVSNDSRPAPFASPTRAHVVLFFGPEIPERYRPLATSVDVVHTGYSCSPCIGPYNQRVSPCNDNQCLKSIDITAVCELVRSRLQARRTVSS